MPDGLKFIRPKRTLSFAGSLIKEVTTPCATDILFWIAQLLPKPGHCAFDVHESKGSSSQFFGGLVSKFSRLPFLRRDSRSSVSSPDGGGTSSTNEFLQVLLVLMSPPETPLLFAQRV